MRIVISIILAVFLVFLIAQIWLFKDRSAAVARESAEVSAELDRAKAESEAIRADYEYYMHPANLEKELRSRFNYRAGDEKILIIVPAATTTRP